uniref:Uncharacterized protein n=1 Tax=Eutreptiella gymnastica TaxID=73025 RepID=A0A7S4LIF0_9EUGL
MLAPDDPTHAPLEGTCNRACLNRNSVTGWWWTNRSPQDGSLRRFRCCKFVSIRKWYGMHIQPRFGQPLLVVHSFTLLYHFSLFVILSSQRRLVFPKGLCPKCHRNGLANGRHCCTTNRRQLPFIRALLLRSSFAVLL